MEVLSRQQYSFQSIKNEWPQKRPSTKMEGPTEGRYENKSLEREATDTRRALTGTEKRMEEILS